MNNVANAKCPLRIQRSDRPELHLPSLHSLVYRLLNPLSFAVGQLAVFQGASDEHI